MIWIKDLRDLATGQRPSIKRNTNSTPQRFTLAMIALLSRVCILLLMSISCSIFPNHNPGDDVYKFSLRFPVGGGDDDGDDKGCFCLRGQSCDESYQSKNDNDVIISETCVDDAMIVAKHDRNTITAIYEFILTPLTRWDASRFLDLAVYPSRRDPPRLLKTNVQECVDPSNQACKELFFQTEQAHAFFPMVPITIRTLANLLTHLLPRNVLPPTYEGVTALAALLWNITCFVFAALALYDLTMNLLHQHLIRLDMNAVDPERKYFFRENDAPQQLAYQAFLIFCFNPASVFFTAAYSESMFAMVNFVGHALWTRIALASFGSQSNQRMLAWLTCLLTVIPLWMTASYTRSNGSINAGWLLLYGIGHACVQLEPNGRPFRALLGLSSSIMLALLVAYPVVQHDQRGYERHCFIEDETSYVIPSWCHDVDNTSPSRFSLYGYVQRQHWNVGIFRYYTLKKIPDFLFATPILTLSICATIDWIHNSFRCYMAQSDAKVANENILKRVFSWAIAVLGSSVDWKKHASNRQLSSGESITSWIHLQLLAGPYMLAHYAILAAVSIVGLIVAHIEITTRMICSSCPAIYWYMTICCCDFGGSKDTENSSKSANIIRRETLGRYVIPYCFLYIITGVIMHPNWLPWT